MIGCLTETTTCVVAKPLVHITTNDGHNYNNQIIYFERYYKSTLIQISQFSINTINAKAHNISILPLKQ